MNREQTFKCLECKQVFEIHKELREHECIKVNPNKVTEEEYLGNDLWKVTTRDNKIYTFNDKDYQELSKKIKW